MISFSIFNKSKTYMYFDVYRRVISVVRKDEMFSSTYVRKIILLEMIVLFFTGFLFDSLVFPTTYRMGSECMLHAYI